MMKYLQLLVNEICVKFYFFDVKQEKFNNMYIECLLWHNAADQTSDKTNITLES